MVLDDYKFPQYQYMHRSEHQKCLTRFVEYHGLSRFGIKMLSFLGITVSTSTMDNHSKKSLTKYDEDIRNVLVDGNCVLCFDNYNHAYASGIYDKEIKNQLRLANFTVFGVSICQKEVDTSFVYDDAKNPIPSVPKSKASFDATSKKLCITSVPRFVI